MRINRPIFGVLAFVVISATAVTVRAQTIVVKAARLIDGRGGDRSHPRWFASLANGLKRSRRLLRFPREQR